MPGLWLSGAVRVTASEPDRASRPEYQLTRFDEAARIRYYACCARRPVHRFLPAYRQWRLDVHSRLHRRAGEARPRAVRFHIRARATCAFRSTRHPLTRPAAGPLRLLRRADVFTPRLVDRPQHGRAARPSPFRRRPAGRAAAATTEQAARLHQPHALRLLRARLRAFSSPAPGDRSARRLDAPLRPTLRSDYRRFARGSHDAQIVGR